MKTIAIIPAAGLGIRMKADIPKQFLTLDGKPILAVTLEKFNGCSLIDGIILVVPSDDVDFCTSEIVGKYGLDKVTKVIPGGKRRQDSVRAGIDAGYYTLIMPVLNQPAFEEMTDELADAEKKNISIMAMKSMKGISLKDIQCCL